MKKLVQLVADAMEKVSNDGVITVEESKTMHTELDLVEGMQFDRGYISAYMSTDMEKMEATPGRSIYPDHRQEDQQYSGNSSAYWSRSFRLVQNFSSLQKMLKVKHLQL